MREIKYLLIILLAASATLFAQVPSLINYQGRLTDEDGNPVSGEKLFSLNIFNSQTDGNLLYTEDLGQITLDDNGVYSFQFGDSGISQAAATSFVGITDGSKNVYNAVLPDSATGVSLITDGTFTWTPATGSSSPTSFIGSYDAASKTVSAIYIGGTPEAGTEISVTYQNSTGGITEALASGPEHWLELSIDGTNQASRTKILAVPFAEKSATANTAAAISGSDSYDWRPEIWSRNIENSVVMTRTYPIYQRDTGSQVPGYVECIIPRYFKLVDRIKLSVYHRIYRNDSPPTAGPVAVKIIEITPNPYAERVIFTSNRPRETRQNNEPFNENVVLTPNIELQRDKIYKIQLSAFRWLSTYGTITSFNVIGKTTPHN